MRLFTKAFALVAAATAVFFASSVGAHSIDRVFSADGTARTHLSAIHSHIKSNQEALASGIRSIQFHAEAVEDCVVALLTRTADNARGCLAIQGAASFQTNCAVDLMGEKCTADLVAAAQLYGGGPIVPTIIPGTTTPAPNAPYTLPKACLITPANYFSANLCRSALMNVGVQITVPTSCTRPLDTENACTADLKAAILVQLSAVQQAETSKCFDAIASYSAKVNATCEPVLQQLSNEYAWDAVDSIINQQCSVMATAGFNACKDAISATAEAQTACPNYNLGLIKAASAEVLHVIDGGLSALCVKDNADSSKYCLAGVVSKFVSMNNNKWDPKKITDSLLNDACRPCMTTVADKIAALGGNVDVDAPASTNGAIRELWNAVSFIQVLCTKDPTNPGAYCAKMFPAIESLSDYADKGVIPSNGDFSNICSPCMDAIIVKAQSYQMSNIVSRIFPGASSQIRSMQSTVCQKDSAGSYCLPSMFSQLSSLAVAFDSCTVSSTSTTQCPQACQFAVQDLYATKCCFATLGLRGILPTIMSVPSLAPYYNRFATAASCVNSVSAKKQCKTPDLDEVGFEITLANVDARLINSTNVAINFKSSLRTDLALAFAIEDSYYRITIGTILFDPATKGGAKVSFTVKLDPALKNAYINTFNQQLRQAGGLPLFNTASTAQYYNALIVDGEPVTASGQGAATSSAAATTGSIAVIALSIVAAFVARF